ncbi:accessory regulator AgrB [Desulfosporosinus fructosivorans]|uniref:Accessory regulator AgrB n=1 Tax=Desulfosporosinus fructosivorans TaxID=2018669 RepID=A0A4Z0RC31_9FIRM|nr:accessory gene regulator B family protein [Desulfosporosinus fructosivorans]TGE39799.1 accessory regulator AgrB [Desulfosporosinus fructosivorans]
MNEISIHKMGHAVGLYVAKKISRLDQAEYLEYGAEILLGSIVKLSIIFFIAAMMQVVLEVAVLLVVTGLIRTLSGGAHCSAYYRCLVISALIFTALGYIIKTVYPFIKLLPSTALLGITVLAMFLYWHYAPQAPLNKPFENKAKELAFRWYTLIVVGTLSATAVIVGTSNLIAWTMAFALLWQGFTLTPAGHRFIGLWDILLTLKKKGGEAEC